MVRPRCALLLAAFVFTLSAFAQTSAPAKTYPGTIRLEVDATRAAENIFRAQETIPVTPGRLDLLFPKWIPGEHGPTGPIVDSTGIKFTANGQVIPWRRDDVEMYEYHLTVPPGVSRIEATLEYDAPVAGEGGFSAGSSATAKMAVLSWNWLVLYPAGYPAEGVNLQPSLRIPSDWKYGTALPQAGEAQASTIQFSPTTLYTLIDSPVIMGEYYRKVELTPPADPRPAEMDIAADSAAALDMPSSLEQDYRNLVVEAGALFGARHYRDYHFLLSLSNHVAHFGLEHHESNDSRTGERGLVDDSGRKMMAGLLPHEYVHSWNGKYRRPLGLATPDYEQPMKGDLLWVYEGLTSYLGDVLTARSGLLTPDEARESLAGIGAALSHRPGREWRPLQDTAVDAQVLYGAPIQWSSWRRGTDFYDEGVLVWLDADTTIRKLSNNQKSLDGWIKTFYGPPDQPLNQAPRVNPYTFDELVASMNRYFPYDWRKFWLDRLDYVGPNAPLGGIENSGWKLVYNDKPSEMTRLRQSRGGVDAAYSLGLIIGKDGRVFDSTLFMPAYQAGIVPGMTIIAVNGRKFSGEVLRDALKAAKTGSEPIQLLAENNEYFKTYAVNYHGGEMYPHLVRDETKPDLLSDILRPHATNSK
jgi:predicted metalloprotease with PDZ domain